MPADGRTYRDAHAAFRAQCKRDNAQCWRCHGRRGPIDYSWPHDPTNLLAFTVDHAQPTSLGGSKTNPDYFRPCHLSCNSSRGNGERRAFPTSRRW